LRSNSAYLRSKKRIKDSRLCRNSRQSLWPG